MTDTTTTSAAEADAIALSLSDIQNVVKIIDFAAEQGAFKGWQTIEQVLVVRSRLHNFVTAALASQPAAEGGEAATAPESTQG